MLIYGQEGLTGVVELKAANVADDDAIAEDDPEVVRLMIDYLYLNDYDPDLITGRPPSDAACERDADHSSKDGAYSIILPETRSVSAE